MRIATLVARRRAVYFPLSPASTKMEKPGNLSLSLFETDQSRGQRANTRNTFNGHTMKRLRNRFFMVHKIFYRRMFVGLTRGNTVPDLRPSRPDLLKIYGGGKKERGEGGRNPGEK